MSLFSQAIEVMPVPPELRSERLLDWPAALLDSLPAAVYACDPDGVIIRYNRRAAELWGRAPRPGDPAERFCGSHRLYRLDGGPIPHNECLMADVLRTGVPVRDQEVVIERPDGSRVVALVNIDAIRDETGAVAGAVNCFQDITARKRAEDELRASQRELEETILRGSERRWRELLEALPAAVYTTDAAGRITFYNQAAVELAGRSPELGTDQWCVTLRLYRPDGTPLPHDECPMAVALRENRAVRGEAVAERPDGTRVPFLAYPMPLRDETGALVGAVNTLVDITERKRAEQIAQRLAAIVESSDDAIVSKDLNGVIATWNQGAERLFGYTAEEVVGKPITILIPPDRQDEEPAILDRIRRGERIEHYETVRRRKDGSLVDVSLAVSPVSDSEGRIVGASKIARDITERRRAQEQQELLLREMGHRVKNLFAVTGAVVALSARSARTPAEMATAVQARLGALTRAHELTRPGLLETGAPAGRDTTLHALVRTIFAPYVDPQRSGDHAGFVVDGPDVPVAGNAVTSLALVLHELATNAAKYGCLSLPNGVVRVDCAIDGSELLLTWTEDGGPALAGPPDGEGFGGLLTRRIVMHQFGGRLSNDWRPEGLIVRLAIPVDRLKS